MGMTKHILALTFIFASVAVTFGCQKPVPKTKPDSQPAESAKPAEPATEAKIEYHHYADPDGDILAFTYTANLEASSKSMSETAKNLEPFIKEPSSPEKTPPPGDTKENYAMRPMGGNCLVAVPSGEKLIEYDVNGASPFFSDDGKYVLKLITHTSKDPSPDMSLCSTLDDSEIWRGGIKFEQGAPFEINVLWDFERGQLILAAIYRPDSPQGLVPLTVIVYDLKNGNILGKTDLTLEFGLVPEWLMNPIYGGGRMFFAAREDPTKGKYELNKDAPLDLWAVEPLSWKSEKIDMKGLPGYPMYEATVDKAGDKLFFNSNGGKFDPAVPYPGNNIVMINLTTGEWRTLLEKSPGKSYGLEGITPDGEILCCAEYKYVDDHKIYKAPLIYNVDTGGAVFLEPSIKADRATDYDLTPSGKYVIEWTHGEDVWVHDIQQGTSRLLIKSSDYPDLLNLPGVPGPYNVH
jgi:hypothetical protein